MTRSHRSAHRILWVVLALAIGLGIAMALLLRKPAEVATTSTIAEALR